ncbi:alkaline phosphatase family protein [Cellulomonas cellasea]|uniref:alkaline phosphatase family protein n=1 Tax=Cellulomonas cellasea TaxID=43670 RepID=UPI0025A46CC1|nr:alkaline phosphatase family protein [Cellulomonas cellasea]MDM8085781.1 alkaline phosphatase family protein [Cellulomonas cellasea]
MSNRPTGPGRPTVPDRSTGAARRWSPTLADAGDAAFGLVTTAVGLGIAIAVVDGVSADNPFAVLLVAAAVGVGDLLLRAPLRLFARLAGAMGALVAGLAAQVAVLWLALRWAPGIELASAWSVAPVLLLTALVMAVGRWLWGVNDSEYVIADVLRRARAQARRRGAEPGPADEREPGLLIVQLDGVGADVLRQAIESGLAPTLARWIDHGSHQSRQWWARVPSTTPASQAGLLHGDSSQVPAFRWWDRGLGRMVVTNHPADAGLVEERLATGKGLLAGGGAAISTMFSGDAASTELVMSRARTAGPDGRGAGLGPGASYLLFFASPFVAARAVVLSIGEMVKELYQARRQKVRGVEPRVSRTGWYVVLRGISNVLLRDLNTSLVAQHLMRGTPTVFVDLVDYDEIAHHAGPTRPEAMRALEGLDRVLGVLERVLPVAGRDYRVVVLSDHGQSLGATFEQVTGSSLLDTVRALMDEPGATAVQAATGEAWGPVNTLLTSMFGRTASGSTVVLGPDADGHGGRGDAGRHAADRRHAAHDGSPHVAGAEPSAGASAPDQADVAVAASGNLGLVWFPGSPRRLVLEEVQERWPGLVPGLAASPGVGAVVVDTATRGLVAVGPRGLVLLEQDQAPEGEDPLAAMGPRARADLARAGRLAHTGDLLLVSRVEPTGHVHAFEGLVGSHGGLGGEQNVAVLVHPTELEVDEDLAEDVGGVPMIVGSENVHVQLVRWAERLGLRP